MWFQEERKDHKDATQKKTSGGEDTRAEARQNLCRVGSPVEKVEARWFTNT